MNQVTSRELTGQQIEILNNECKRNPLTVSETCRDTHIQTHAFSFPRAPLASNCAGFTSSMPVLVYLLCACVHACLCTCLHIQIEITHRQKGLQRYKIRGFTPTSARKSVFDAKEGRKVSVETYFK